MSRTISDAYSIDLLFCNEHSQVKQWCYGDTLSLLNKLVILNFNLQINLCHGTYSDKDNNHLVKMRVIFWMYIWICAKQYSHQI